MQAEVHQDKGHHRLVILIKRGNNHHPDHLDQGPAVEVEEEATGDHLLTKMTMMATILVATGSGRATDLQNFMNSPASDQTRPAKSVMITGSRSYT